MGAVGTTVSVIIPCYNEEGTLRELYERVQAQFALLQLKGEIVFVDDGSTDRSRAILRELAAADPDCRIIAFRRNSGKAAALQTGFAVARGEFVLTMDADLQDDPVEIPRFLEALQRADVVSGWKAIRHDPIGKTLPSRVFNAVVREVTGVKLHDMNCGFKGYRRQVVREVTLYGELHRFIPALAAARGFTIEELVVTHHPRRSGKSKYGWERFIRGLFDLVTVNYLNKYRFRPLHLFGSIGLLCILFSVALGALLSIYLTKAFGPPPPWHFFVWLFDAAVFTLGPVFIGLGMLAEGNLAAQFDRYPPPPIAECINLTDAKTSTAPGEVTHAG
ncbi:MAG TPA: glycosyltransferase family 2 protein [Armatimonadota bacterium]